MSDLLIQRPAFSSIEIQSIETQLDVLLAECRRVVSQIAQLDKPSWDTLVQPLAEAQNTLGLFWSPISHLNSVMNNDELREVYKNCLPKLSSYHTELGQNTELYNTTLALKNSTEFSQLKPEQQRQIEHDLRDFELGSQVLG